MSSTSPSDPSSTGPSEGPELATASGTTTQLPPCHIYYASTSQSDQEVSKAFTPSPSENDDQWRYILKNEKILQYYSEQGISMPPFPPKLNVSGTDIRPKEVILISLALLLLVCSILLFFKHWKKNYRDINQLPYYAYLYQKEAAEFVSSMPPPVVPPQVMGATANSTANEGDAKDIEEARPHTRIGLGSSAAFSGSSRRLPGVGLAGTGTSFPGLLPRSHSVRAMHLMGNTAAAGSPLNTLFATTARAHMLSRVGAEAPGYLLSSCNTGSLARLAVPTPGTPPSGFKTRPRPPFGPPKRAASDVYVRFQRCRHDFLQRVNQQQNSSLLTEEKASSIGGAAVNKPDLFLSRRMTEEDEQEDSNSSSASDAKVKHCAAAAAAAAAAAGAASASSSRERLEPQESPKKLKVELQTGRNGDSVKVTMATRAMQQQQAGGIVTDV